ncbi:TPA: phage tail protein [Streptococcus suis]|nr:phage tail protein [Streptococcus suis]HEM5651195.1 phage tail protein [Streptococcus suis]
MKFNELVIDGVKTSSFPFDVIVYDSPSFITSNSKTQLYEHDGISGAVVQTNKHRSLIEKSYTLYLLNPSETDMYRFMSLFQREGFWLESERVKTTRLWCYRVNATEAIKEGHNTYKVNATFICHPTKYFKSSDTQTLTRNGVIWSQGSALAFPKITISGSSVTETTFTVGKQVIRLEKLSEPLVMINDPSDPSFKTASGKLIKWSGDFITIDPTTAETVGVALGSGITSLKFETVWGWA